MEWQEVFKHLFKNKSLFCTFLIFTITNFNPFVTVIIIFQSTMLGFYRKRVPRLRLTKEERDEIAFIAKALPKTWLENFVPKFKYDTMRKWMKALVSFKFDSSQHPNNKNKTGRPRLPKNITKLVLKIIKENPSYGDQTIADIVKRLHHQCCSSTVANIRKEHDIPPAKERVSQWHRLKNSKNVWGMDFFTQQVITSHGIATLYVLVFVHWHSRRLVVGGSTVTPTSEWVGRVIQDKHVDDEFSGASFMVHDNDSMFNEHVKHSLKSIEIKPIKTAIRAPKMNSHTERIIRTLRKGTGNKPLALSQQNFMKDLRDFERFYNTERHHQGLPENAIPFPTLAAQAQIGRVTKYSRSAGRDSFYFRKVS